jgi:hypothetical protein
LLSGRIGTGAVVVVGLQAENVAAIKMAIKIKDMICFDRVRIFTSSPLHCTARIDNTINWRSGHKRAN